MRPCPRRAPSWHHRGHRRAYCHGASLSMPEGLGAVCTLCLKERAVGMSDIALQPAHALAEAIRRRDVSSRELLDHYLARVDALNPPLGAVVTLDPDAARRAADAADAALVRGEEVGPLHGVPMTIKDTYETEGMRTTCGLAAWDHVSD